MRDDLREALLNHLFQLMADHIDRGLSWKEAEFLAVGQIRQQILGTRRDLAAMLIDETVSRMRAWDQTETRH